MKNKTAIWKNFSFHPPPYGIRCQRAEAHRMTAKDLNVKQKRMQAGYFTMSLSKNSMKVSKAPQ